MKELKPRNNFGLLDKYQSIVKTLDTVRKQGVDISLKQYVESELTDNNSNKLTFDQFLADAGIDPNVHTFDNVISAPFDTRWLVPEIIREAIREGLRRAPIYPNIIRSDEPCDNVTVTLPKLNFSGDTKMETTNEGEVIPVGYVSYGSKTVPVSKVARGIQITYEAIRFTKLNLVNVFFEDVGVRLGHSLDAAALAVAINGDQDGGTESAPVIGVDTVANGVTYYDQGRVWVRGGLIGRNFQTMIGDEAMALKIINLDEYKDRAVGAPMPLNVHIPIVTNPELYAHVNIPASKLLMMDKNFSLIKLTAESLQMESEAIINRQLKGTYVWLITGFAKLFRDAAILVDGTVDFDDPGNGWPDWMTVGYAD